MDLTKILTISARDYCDMKGKFLGDYEPIGVHSCTSEPYPLINTPAKAEVVVDYRFFCGSDSHHYSSGTALIPKR